MTHVSGSRRLTSGGTGWPGYFMGHNTFGVTQNLSTPPNAGNTSGNYWTSTVATNYGHSRFLYFGSHEADLNQRMRDSGLSVRCIMD